MSEQKRNSGTAHSITARTIREFSAPPAVRGYDRGAVDAFLSDVADSYEHALNVLATYERRVLELETVTQQSAPPRADEAGGDGALNSEALHRELQYYREREHAVAAALVVAQQAASEIRSKAEQEAEEIRTATATALDGLHTAAQEEADRIVSEARLRAKKIDDEASADRSAFERELERLRSLKEATRQDLSEFLTQALSGLQETGDDDRAAWSGAQDEKETDRTPER
jgi:DivIVA domain-containing protein